jgi:perosamine synthetase
MIPVARPDISQLERDYVADAMASGLLTSGPYLDRFEADFAAWQGYRHCVATCNGTTALHLALVAMGVGPGVEVIVPTLTFVATAAAVVHAGGVPVFVDSLSDGTMDPGLARRAMTAATGVVLPVHLYGSRARLEELARLGPRMLVDAAEGHGIPNAGHPAAFSFYGNKILTTGEGGAVCTDCDDMAARLRHLRGQAQTERRFWHDAVGFNYRMTNVAAAIGCAQLERVDGMLARRREWRAFYAVHGVPLDAADAPWCANVRSERRDEIAAQLSDAGIETRAGFPLVHTMPPYAGHRCIESGDGRAAEISDTLLTIPLSSAMTIDEADAVCSTTRSWFNGEFTHWYG